MFAAGVEALSDFVSVLVSVFISGLVSDLVSDFGSATVSDFLSLAPSVLESEDFGSSDLLPPSDFSGARESLTYHPVPLKTIPTG